MFNGSNAGIQSLDKEDGANYFLLLFCCNETDKQKHRSQGTRCVVLSLSQPEVQMTGLYTVSTLFLLHCAVANLRHMFVFQQPSCTKQISPTDDVLSEA